MLYSTPMLHSTSPRVVLVVALVLLATSKLQPIEVLEDARLARALRSVMAGLQQARRRLAECEQRLSERRRQCEAQAAALEELRTHPISTTGCGSPSHARIPQQFASFTSSTTSHLSRRWRALAGRRTSCSPQETIGLPAGIRITC